MPCEFLRSIHDVDAQMWNALCPDNYPFVRHEFLAALEDSGSTTAESGWQPRHLLIRDGDQVIAAMPLFLKRHSYGEYVFDWAWADAYQRHGCTYYPKLVSAIPFTPCRGPRLLTGDAPISASTLDDLTTGLREQCAAADISGWHCLFPESDVCELLHARGIRRRLGVQFHWFNRGYRDFAEFVGAMNSRKRKNILKERRHVAAQGFQFAIKEGAEISAADWNFFYALYQATYRKRSGHGGYLTADFFQRVGTTLSAHILMIIASHNRKPVAAALYFVDEETLYGRYWGCAQEFEFLHFETCYYQGIDYAIARGLKRFDGGAQGEHKISRGFEPVPVWSNHWLAHPQFFHAIGEFTEREESLVRRYMEEARELLPFREVSAEHISD